MYIHFFVRFILLVASPKCTNTLIRGNTSTHIHTRKDVDTNTDRDTNTNTETQREYIYITPIFNYVATKLPAEVADVRSCQ